jgi:hypothetical protein
MIDVPSAQTGYNLMHRILAAIVHAVLVLLIGCSRAELPPFDFEKWKTLSPEKRQQYDVVFFNEMQTWNVNSNRYPPGQSHLERRAEFERMAADGYLPAYVAVRLAGIWPAEERHDPEALQMLLDEAARGDVSAMCAVVVMPIKNSLLTEEDRRNLGLKMMTTAAQRGHGACMGSYGGALLLGNVPGIRSNAQAAMSLLFESARQGYYVAASRLFYVRQARSFKGEFDFTDRLELERAMCWGRLAEQHTNWAGFSNFLGRLRDHARANNRPDLIEASYRLDPKRVPITERAVKPEDCIRLEKGG